MTIYKLTDADGRTFGDTQWDEGIEHRASGEGGLCGPGWLHAYEHPLLAVLHNPIHGNFQPDTMRLWEAETEDENPLRDGYMKLGVRHLRTVREIPVPVVTAGQRVRYAILCAMEVYSKPEWIMWAEGWLSGRDRSAAAAAAAAAIAAAAAWAVAWAWVSAWARAAAAVLAAEAAVNAVWVEKLSTKSKAQAAVAAEMAARAAAAAAETAARAAQAELGLPRLAERAIAEDKP